MRLLCISINLPSGHAWNAVVMSWLVLLFATWNCWKSYKNRYAGLLVIHLLPLLTPWLIIEPLADSIGIALLDVHLNRLNWFHFLILEGDLLVFCHHSEMLQGCLYKDFFPCTARLCIYMELSAYRMTHSLTHDKTVGCFLNRFPICFNLFLLLFFVTLCPVVAVQPSMESIPTFFFLKTFSIVWHIRKFFVSHWSVHLESLKYYRSLKIKRYHQQIVLHCFLN